MSAHLPPNLVRAPARVARAADEEGVDALTQACMAMPEPAAYARIDREVRGALAASRWADAVTWQRVLLRVKRLRARARNDGT